MAEKTGADWVLYQELEDLEAAVREVNPDITQFDSSCFRSASSLAVSASSVFINSGNIRTDVVEHHAMDRTSRNPAR